MEFIGKLGRDALAAISVGYWTVSAIRRTMLMAASAVVLLLGVASATQAASFYWYGENNSTCWQTGQPGSSSSACDDVGEHFLNSSNPPRMIEGSGYTDVNLTSGSGDYCNAYDIGDSLIYTDENSEGKWTGFTPPTPYGSWQEGDTHETVCQAGGTVWGQEVRGAANSECKGSGHEPCGMQHYVSLQSQGDRPWSSSFASPSLLITSEADPQTATVHTGAWGYICPLLRQATTNKVIEYCFEQWRIGKGFPGTEAFDVRGACAPAGNYVFDQVITDFASNTKFATEMAGSASTFVFDNNPSPKTFAAYITEANLLNAINTLNKPSNEGGCGEGLTTNLSEYELIGIEQGMEGGNLSELGGHTANLQARTEYTHYQIPPTAATQEATGMGETEATVHGSVNPEGSATEAYFEYGPTTKYGNKVPSPTGWPIGEAATFIPAYITLSGLEPGTTYHFRVVGKNADGTSPGSDQTFTTRGADQYVFYDESGSLAESFWKGASWGDAALGHAITGSPAVGIDAAGEEFVFYNENGSLGESWWNGSHWSYVAVGHGISGSPAVAVTSKGEQVVFYDGGGYLDESVWNGSSWGWVATGHPITGTPSVAITPSGEQFVYFNENGSLMETFWNGTSGGYVSLDHGITEGPEAAVDANSEQFVFYNDKGSLDESWWNGSSWGEASLGRAISGSPAVGVTPGGEQYVFYNSGGSLDESWWSGSSWGYAALGHVITGNPAVALNTPLE